MIDDIHWDRANIHKQQSVEPFAALSGSDCNFMAIVFLQ